MSHVVKIFTEIWGADTKLRLDFDSIDRCKESPTCFQLDEHVIDESKEGWLHCSVEVRIEIGWDDRKLAALIRCSWDFIDTFLYLIGACLYIDVKHDVVQLGQVPSLDTPVGFEYKSCATVLRCPVPTGSWEWICITRDYDVSPGLMSEENCKP